MDYVRWMIRAKRWAQNPPSPTRVKLVFGVIGLCLLIVAYERAFGWPAWLAVDSLRLKP